MPRRPHKWRDLMEPVTRARAGLGLNATDLALLRAILSFVPSDLLGCERPETHICFAGNLALADRLGTSGDSTVNRGLRKLEAAGLIARRPSANRKRYAHRARDGAILHAYGIDLSPLIARAAELAARARAADAAREALTHLRERCKALMLELAPREAGQGDPEAEALLAEARRALRRKPETGTLRALGDRLAQALATRPHAAPAAPFESAEMSDSAGQDERHIEQKEELPETPTPGRKRTGPLAFHQIAAAFPTLVAYLDGRRSPKDIEETCDLLAGGLGDASAAWRGCKRELGFSAAFVILGFILENLGKVENPGGYIRALTLEARGDGRLLAALVTRGARARRGPAPRPCRPGVPVQ